MNRTSADFEHHISVLERNILSMDEDLTRTEAELTAMQGSRNRWAAAAGALFGALAAAIAWLLQ